MLRRLLCVAMCITCLSSGVWGKQPKAVIDGKSVDHWIKQLKGKKEKDVRHAIHTLGKCRFLVDAPERVLPELYPWIRGKGTLSWSARNAVAEYGQSANAGLRFWGEHLRKQWDKEPDEDRRVGLEPGIFLLHVGTPKQVRAAIGDVRSAMYRERDRYLQSNLGLNTLLMTLARLGVRGEIAAEFVQGDIITFKRYADIGTLMWLADDLGPAAGPLKSHALSALKDREPVIRMRAVDGLAWIEMLSPDDVKRVLSAARKSVPRGGRGGTLARALTFIPREPKAEVIKYLRKRLSSSDQTESTWCMAALARLEPKPDVVKRIQGRLSYRDHDARVAAVDGLLNLPELPETLLPAMEFALGDPDLRVRWRAAAALIKAGRPPEELIPELARGLDSPDDLDRIEFFRALARIGAPARALADQVKPWATYPIRLIADPASRAYKAIGSAQPEPSLKDD